MVNSLNNSLAPSEKIKLSTRRPTAAAHTTSMQTKHAQITTEHKQLFKNDHSCPNKEVWTFFIKNSSLALSEKIKLSERWPTGAAHTVPGPIDASRKIKNDKQAKPAVVRFEKIEDSNWVVFVILKVIARKIRHSGPTPKLKHSSENQAFWTNSKK